MFICWPSSDETLFFLLAKALKIKPNVSSISEIARKKKIQNEKWSWSRDEEVMALIISHTYFSLFSTSRVFVLFMMIFF
jgi:hypothetical protein